MSPSIVSNQHGGLTYLQYLQYILLSLSSHFTFPILPFTTLNWDSISPLSFLLLLSSLLLSPPQFTFVSLPTDTYYLPEQPGLSLVHISLYLFYSLYPPTLSTSLHPTLWIHRCGKLLNLPTPSNLVLIHHLTLPSASPPVAHPSLANSRSWIIAVREKFSMHTWWALWSISLSLSPSESLSLLLNPTLSNWRAQF